MDINFLKIALKTEIKNISSKTMFLVLACLATPFIFKYFYVAKEYNYNILLGTILFSITLGVFQYILDSTTNDILNKINIFYSNLNIPRIYSLISKILICIPFVMTFFNLNLIFFKIKLISSFILITLLLSINICLYTSIIVSYFFDSNSMLFSTYLSMFFVLGLSFFILGLLILKINIILILISQLIIIIIGFYILNRIYKLKKILIKIL